MRVPKTDSDGVISGYFSDPERLTSAAAQVSGRGPGVYVTLNQLPPELLERANNRWASKTSSTTKDSDVLHRNWLLLDFDPPRPANSSSTDAEHEVSIATARHAAHILESQGWPKPIIGDSGNGAHLLYWVSLPNDSESVALVRDVLKACALRWNSRHVTVDTTVHNAGRISKLYGTVAAKGPHTDERPHRVSRILEMPPQIEPVAEELLRQVAAEVIVTTPQAALRPAEVSHSVEFSLENWLGDHGIRFRPPVDDGGSLKYTLYACPFNPEHKGRDAAVFRRPDGSIRFFCFHNSCSGKLWADLRELYEPGYQQRKASFAARSQRASSGSNGHAATVVAEDPEEDAQPEPKKDFKAHARALIAEIVESKDVTKIYENSFISALAMAGTAVEYEALREFKKLWPKDLAGNILGWKAKVREAREESARAAYVPREGWQKDLIYKADKNGNLHLVLCEANAILYFENHPDWQGVLGYNHFTAQHAVLLAPPSPVRLKPGDFLEDHHDTQFARWLQVETEEPWKVEMVRRAVDCWARDRGFHPVRDYLDSLPKWKPGDPERLKTWLFDYAGAGPGEAEENPDEALMNFMAAAGERWMISAIARIRNPGCEVHHMLVLEGGEGLGKSMLVKTIGRGWSQVMQGALDGRSAQELIASAVWIWEFAELASLKKTQEVESAKAFITNPEETFRPAYGRRVIRHKRECAFVATVNNDQYFDSSAWEDGKRRAWPIRCTRPFDLVGLEENIDLLWAEADYKFKNGHRWHFDRDEDSALIDTAKVEQAARVPESVLTDTFVGAAKRVAEAHMSAVLFGSASVSEILAALDVAIEKRKGMQPEVGRCLKAAGWALYQPRVNGKQLRRWKEPG